MDKYIKKIRTENGDMQIDYNSLANLPKIPSIEGLASEKYVDDRFEKLIGAAPEALDTLEELSKALNNDSDFAAIVVEELAKKATKEEIKQAISEIEIPGVKIGEYNCFLAIIGDIISNGFYLKTMNEGEYVDIRDLFSPDNFDYEIQPAEDMSEEAYDLFCAGKFYEKSNGVLYSRNSDWILLDKTDSASSILNSIEYDNGNSIFNDAITVDDCISSLKVKVIIITTSDNIGGVTV